MDVAASSPAAVDTDPVARAAAAEQHMYEAEVTLHAARMAEVDSWVAAAYDRLHAAIAEHCEATTLLPS
jgi:hypothetical protein